LSLARTISDRRIGAQNDKLAEAHKPSQNTQFGALVVLC
jgi:hypothetical protein